METERSLHIGTVVGVHGIKGWLKVAAYAESPELFDIGRQLTVKTGSGETAVYTVRDVRPHKNLLRVAFETVESREAAEALKGAELMIDRAELPEPEDGSWYWCDLIGLVVYEGEVRIGRVENIFATGSNDVLVVRDGEAERLIPALESIVRGIDLDSQTITVDLPEGL